MRARQIRQFAAATAPILLAMTLAGCSAPTDTAPAEEAAQPSTVENPALRIRLVDVPSEFQVDANQARDLVLSHTDPAVGGDVVIVALPPEDGQNLVSAVAFHEAFIENQEDGDYQGGQELVGPLGTAFYSRGRFTLEGEAVEETKIFTLHPDGDRMLTLRYRYPAGVDSSVRVQQLFDLLATIEGLGG
jgi:hypothetical protein